MICHLCYGDEKTSVKILSLVNSIMKTKNIPLPFIETVFNNAISVYTLKDALTFIRLDTLFQLNNESISYEEQIEVEQCNNKLFEYYYETRGQNLNLVLYMLYNIGNAIEKNKVINQYFQKYKNQLRWIKDFLIELKSDMTMRQEFLKNNQFILSQHPDLFQVINKNMIKNFGFDSN